jgi:hypothetical protein
MALKKCARKNNAGAVLIPAGEKESSAVKINARKETGSLNFD